MVCRVAERALAARNVSRVIIATDSQQILEVALSHGIEAVLTDQKHESGTDRIAEVAIEIIDAEIIVNLQGDEPLISPETIERAVSALIAEGETGAGIATTWESIESTADVFNPDVVKIALDSEGYAVSFSRSPIPFPREAVRRNNSLQEALKNEPDLLKLFRRHTGLYVYRREVLLSFTSWPQTHLEKTEALEQLRALEHGVKIKAIEASTPSTGIDTPQDLARVRALIEAGKVQLLVR